MVLQVYIYVFTFAELARNLLLLHAILNLRVIRLETALEIPALQN